MKQLNSVIPRDKNYIIICSAVIVSFVLTSALSSKPAAWLLFLNVVLLDIVADVALMLSNVEYPTKDTTRNIVRAIRLALPLVAITLLVTVFATDALPWHSYWVFATVPASYSLYRVFMLLAYNTTTRSQHLLEGEKLFRLAVLSVLIICIFIVTISGEGRPLCGKPLPACSTVNACGSGCEDGEPVQGEIDCWCKPNHYFSEIGMRCIEWCSATQVSPSSPGVDCCGTALTESTIRHMAADSNCVCGQGGNYSDVYRGCVL